MRLKKLMSLVLACAMALSLVTVASAADTEVYYVEDFSGYADITNYFATSSGMPASAQAAVELAKPTDVTNRWAYKSTNDAMNITRSEFGTNSLGSKSLLTYNGTSALNKTTTWYHLPDNAWDFTAADNQDETYVISYEVDMNPRYQASKATHYVDTATIWGGTYTTGDEGTTWTVAPNFMQATWTELGAGDSATSTPQSTVSYKFMYANKQNGSTDTLTHAVGTARRIAIGFKYNSSNSKANAAGDGVYYYPTRLFANEGTLVRTADNDYTGFTSFEGRNNLYGWYAASQSTIGHEYANIRMYTIKTDDFKVTAQTTTDVPLNTKSMRIFFSNIVSSATYTDATKDAIVVKADGIPMAEGTYGIGNRVDVIGEVGGEIYSYVDISFTALEEGTTYTVEFPETITNEIGTTLTGKNIATFATKMPDVKIMPLTVVGAESLVANGELQAVKATLINNTSAPKNVALIYAVYAGDKLADIVYINDSVEDTTDYEVGLKLASAGTVKAFAWDGMTSLKPYTGSVQLTVAAAQ